MTPFEAAVARVSAGADAGEEARRLIAQMTIEEKLGCLDGDTPFWDGLVDSIEGGYWQHPWPAAVVERLGIPGIHFSDGPRGVVIGPCTAFPVSMARGASFDPELEERIGEAIGRELRAVGANFYGGICVNLLRHPAWGRAQETYGEDPFLVGEMGAALARGVQRYTLACVKHFACNSMENARFKVDVQVGERALHEVYLPHFRRVVREGVASVMSAYNSLNGHWCGENRELLTSILRDEWGFEGFVISDFQFGLRDPVGSVEAGLDIEMPYIQLRARSLPAAVANGELSLEAVEARVEAIVSTLLRFATRIDVRPQTGEGGEVVAGEAHRRLAREAASAGMVLLRNEAALLPLDAAQLKRIAVVGPLAATRNLGDGGSSDVRPREVVTPLDGLRAALPQTEILFEDGRDLARVRAAAEEADVAVVVVGYTSRDEGEYIDVAGMGDLFHLFPPMDDPATIQPRLTAALQKAVGGGGFAPGGDRKRLSLGEGDEVLIEAVTAVNPRTIVAVMGGSAVLMERWREQAAAILLLWYPGMEGGHALAEVLLGHAEPTGRLPFAMAASADHLPAFDRDASSARYDLWHGQWKLDRDGHAAAYPFGFGLSYGELAPTEARLIGSEDERQVAVEVINRGRRDGSTVLQIYGSRPESGFERPLRRLLGFRKVKLAGGERTTVQIPLSLEALRVRQDGRWFLEPGAYRLTVGQYAGDPDSLGLTLNL